MAGWRARLSWMLNGRQQVIPTLDALTRDLQDLQAKVGALGDSLARIEAAVRGADAERLAELDRIRRSVTDAADDLQARFAAWTAAREGGQPT